MIGVCRTVAVGGFLAGCLSSTMLAVGSLAVLGLTFSVGRKGVTLLWQTVVRAFKWWRRYRKPLSDNHGAARFVTMGELTAAGLLGGKGLFIGKCNGRFLRHPSPEASMIVFAPQGAGKGVGVVRWAMAAA